jgi:hypothetical protein
VIGHQPLERLAGVLAAAIGVVQQRIRFATPPELRTVVGIFRNEASIIRLIGAVLLEQNDEWLLQHRYMQIEGMAELTPPTIETEPTKLPPKAA